MLLTQIVIGTAMIVSTTVVHAVGLVYLSRHILRALPDSERPMRSGKMISVLCASILGLFFLHSVEIWAWAGLYLWTGELTDLNNALYFSSVTFTTLGYGDLTLSRDWQVLSGFEAANGIVLFGVSIAMILWVFGRIVEDSLATSGTPGDDDPA